MEELHFKWANQEDLPLFVAPKRRKGKGGTGRMQRATRTFKEIENTSKNSGPYSVQRRIFLADGLGDGSRPARRPLRKYF